MVLRQGNKPFEIRADFRTSLWKEHYAYVKKDERRATDVHSICIIMEF